MRVTIAAAALVFGLARACADPATPEGARKIEATYAAYFSQDLIDDKIVTVTPRGDDYVIAWDFEKALAAMGAPAHAAAIAPFVYRLTPTLGGGWLVRASSLPKLTVPPSGESGREGGTAAFQGFRFEGLYDPGAMAPFRAKLSLGSLKIDARARSGGLLKHFVVSQEGVASDMQVKAGERAGEVDIVSTQSFAGADQQTSVLDDDGEPHDATDSKQGAASGDGQVTGLRVEAIGDLWRFLVSEIGKGPIAPEALKPKLEALAPLWREAEGRGEGEDIAITFPGGAVSMKSASQEGKLTGLVEHASAALALTVNDVKLDLADAPDWLTKIWPATLALKVEASVDGLDRATQMALDDPDLLKSGKLDEGTKSAIRETLLAGRPRVRISQTRLSTPLLDATFEGDAEFGVQTRAHAHVTSDDLDKLLQALADVAPSEPRAQQFLYVATFARGLARVEDGRLVWDIDFVGPGGVRVNGHLFSQP